MIALLQRVIDASVEVDGATVASISSGLLVLVGVRREDSDANARRLADRLLRYRVFEDASGKMNHCLNDRIGTEAGLLLVPQFTLAADTKAGNRPSFSPAAAPDHARELFDHLAAACRAQWPAVEVGIFRAHMRVRSTNDGPVTLWLEG